jgi:enoyl-[acyl-carrier protein] reductase I
MSHQLLNGKKGIISGALNEQSIAWKVALRAKEEGARFVLTNAPIAGRLGEINKLAELCETEIIYADATVVEDIENLYKNSMKVLGGKVDFVLHSIGMSPNIRKDKDHGSLNYDWFIKTLDVSALSFHKMLQVADNLDAVNEYGSFVALTYIAAQRSFPFYSDMAQAKALLESIARGYGYRFAKKNKVRINTVSQSPTKTTAGQGIGGFDGFFEYAHQMSPLGNAPAEACADYVVTLFSDLTRYVTMQNLYHDGGFSSMGLSQEIMEMIKPAQ